MTTVTEVFEVGQQRFEWFPFPSSLSPIVTEQPFTTGLGYEAGLSNEHLAEPRNQSPQSFAAVDHLEIGSVVPGSKVNERVCNKNSAQDRKELHSGAAKIIKAPMAYQKSSTKSVKALLPSQKSSAKSIKAPQSLQKGLADIKEPQTSQKGSKKAFQGPHLSQKGSARNAREPQTLPKQTFQLWPTISKAKEETKRAEPPAQRVSECKDDVMDIEEEPAAASCGKLQVMQESADKATEAAGSLENCPICLMQFPKQ